jgi:hypothetical protein
LQTRWVALKRADLTSTTSELSLAAESVERASLALESVDDVHGGDGLSLGVLRVRDGVADDVLEEDLEHAAGLLVDEPRDALHAATASEATDGRLGDALDVVAQDLAMTLRASLSEALAAFAASGHCADSMDRRCEQQRAES